MVSNNSVSAEYTIVATTASPEETKRCAAALAGLLRGSEVLTLDGDLGAGKTQFTQGLAAGLGIVRQVTSPTFNVLLVYDEGRIPLYHFDLYRLEKPAELDDIAFTEYMDSPGVSCIEWASKFPEQLPEERLAIVLETADHNRRVIKARAFGSAVRSLLAAWFLCMSERIDGKGLDDPSRTLRADTGIGAQGDTLVATQQQAHAQESKAKAARTTKVDTQHKGCDHTVGPERVSRVSDAKDRVIEKSEKPSPKPATTSGGGGGDSFILAFDTAFGFDRFLF